MAKATGLGDNFYVSGFNLSGDVGSVDTLQGGNSPIEVTGLDKSAIERLGGLRSGSIEFTSYFNDATRQEHAALSTLSMTDRIASYFRGTTLGNQAASVVGKQINYDPSRGADGSLTITTQVQSNGFGLEWGRMHTAGVRTDSTATNGTGVEHGASTTFGLQMYVHLFDFTGTSVTIKLQESSDNAAADPYADVVGATTTALTGTGAERIATASNLTVESWLRVVTTGTFSNAAFAVSVVRNLATPVF